MPREPLTILVDGHVHVHPVFAWDGVLAAAVSNFDRARSRLGLAEPGTGCLMLTESAGAHAFRSLRDRPAVVAAAGWRATPAGHGGAIATRRADGSTIWIVAGRQIVTREDLEVLALACDREFPDGLPLRDVLLAVVAAGGVPVIPWGFGKWWFGRGRLLRTLIEETDPPRFFLGDNGGRPRLGLAPPLFALARERGIPVLPGSDPLPFPGQDARVGSYGFTLAGADPAPGGSPDAWVRAALAGLDRQPPVFGGREGLIRFVRSQIGMQFVKRRRRRATGHLS
jgi:hypothetical protein